MKPSHRWLEPDDVLLDVRELNKRVLLQTLAHKLAARSGTSAATVFRALWDREALGSTALGHGVALPHARLPALERPIAAFVRMRPAIAFDAPDDKPVELILALLLPGREPQRQLELLASIATALSEAPFRARLLQADSAVAVADLLAGGPAS